MKMVDLSGMHIEQNTIPKIDFLHGFKVDEMQHCQIASVFAAREPPHRMKTKEGVASVAIYRIEVLDRFIRNHLKILRLQNA